MLTEQSRWGPPVLVPRRIPNPRLRTTSNSAAFALISGPSTNGVGAENVMLVSVVGADHAFRGSLRI